MELKLQVPLQQMYPGEHVRVEDGVFYITPRARRLALPARFTAALDKDSPWSTMVFGVETGRFAMRERALEAMRAAVASGDDAWLERLGDLMEAAFHGIFGHRGLTWRAPAFEQWVLASIRAESDERVKRTLARGLKRAMDPEAVELRARYGVERDTYLCRDPGPEQARDAGDEARDVGEVLRDNAMDGEARLLARARRSDEQRARVGEQLRAFVRGLIEAEVDEGDDADEYDYLPQESEWLARRGLTVLARIDRAAAREVAAELEPLLDPESFELRAVVSSLREHNPPGALEAALDRMGVTPLAGAPAPTEPAVTAVEALAARGRVVGFDSETGHVPASHPDVLYWLADITGELGDVHFDQRVKWDRATDEPAQGLSFTLCAYAGGYELTAKASYEGDFYDVGACIGFFNGLLKRAKSAWRVVQLDPIEQGVGIAAAPLAALIEMRDAGLLSWGGPLEADEDDAGDGDDGDAGNEGADDDEPAGT